MRKIVLAGFGNPLLDLVKAMANEFEIVGVVLDYQRKLSQPTFHETLSQLPLKQLTLQQLADIDVDLVVVINYNKLIPSKFLVNTPFVNIHMGVLPVYRGNNANASSILNGDRSVGYTLHEVNAELDGGNILHTFQYEILENETYWNAKVAIQKNIANEISGLINNYLEGDLVGKPQENVGFVYASSIIPEDGILSDWKLNTDDIINLNMIFSKPLGTGLKFRYKDSLIEIVKVSKVDGFLKSKGVCGGIVLINAENGIWVKTLDTAICIDSIAVDGKVIKPGLIFKIGNRL
jgi:methionyl-tRNA formyltransferase